MEIRSVNPWDRCSQLGETGFAPPNCQFACGHCTHQVHFEMESLAARHYRTSSEGQLFFLLPDEQSGAFADVIERHVKGLFDRFVTDFNCPQCHAPIVIMWRWQEGEDGQSLYEPLTVLEAATWPAG